MPEALLRESRITTPMVSAPPLPETLLRATRSDGSPPGRGPGGGGGGAGGGPGTATTGGGTGRPRRRDHRPSPQRRRRDGLIAALDVGTTKIACLIAEETEAGDLRVLGVGHQRSRGLRCGQVTNMDDAELAIRATVDAAEKMAEDRIAEVVLNVSGGQPHSTRVAVEMSIAGRAVRESDVRRIQAFGRDQHRAEDRELVHCIPVSYAIDGADGIIDPRGMYGQTLGVTIHLVSVAVGPLRNLCTVVDRCHLDIEDRVVSPYAAGLACLVEDEKDMGATVIDMGGGTTSLAVFLEGHMVHAGVIPLGGQHVTNDIVQVLTTPMPVAERLKTYHGSCQTSPADHREMLRVPQVGDDEEINAHDVPRSMLVQIIRPRLEETLELVRSHLDAAGFLRGGGRQVVLTGGASQLQGVRDLAETILERPVRLGRPQRILGLAESASGPAFATCAGLLRYALRHQVETPAPDPVALPVAEPGVLGRMARWWKENF